MTERIYTTTILVSGNSHRRNTHPTAVAPQARATVKRILRHIGGKGYLISVLFPVIVHELLYPSGGFQKAPVYAGGLEIDAPVLKG